MMKLFETGRIVATPGAMSVLAETGTDPMDLLNRHASGDWGDVPAEDAKENLFSIKHGFRVMSSYRIGSERVWIITESDRNSSCLLLPSEY
jgi:hypothetical protein